MPESPGIFSLETLGQILTRVEKDVDKISSKLNELDDKTNALVDQKSKLSGGISVLRWLFGSLFVLFMTGGGYLLATINGHTERIVTLEVTDKNTLDRIKDERVDQTQKITAVEQKAAAVPQLTDEVANLTKAVSDRSSDVDKIKDEVSQEQDQIGKLTHRVGGAEDDITLLKARPTPKAH